MAEERIQKILAKAGFGSRRDCEEYLRAGRITVNGLQVELGAKADPAKDQICLDRKPIQAKIESIYIALNKPRQVLSAINQDDDRKDVLDLVPFDGHLFPVGRLDFDSEGLLLLTNDGDFANKLAHPRYEHEKEYIVQIGSRPDDEQLNTWRRGVVLEDGYRTQPAKIEVIETQPKSATLRITLKEGRKRQIRESGERIGLPVQKIKRVRIGTILLGNLKTGEWRNLTRQEIVSMSKRSPSKIAGAGKTEVTEKSTTVRKSKPVAVWRGRKPSSGEGAEGSSSRTPRTRKPFSENEGYSKPARPQRKRSTNPTDATPSTQSPDGSRRRASSSTVPTSDANPVDGFRRRPSSSTGTSSGTKPANGFRRRTSSSTGPSSADLPADGTRRRTSRPTGPSSAGKPTTEGSRRRTSRPTEPLSAPKPANRARKPLNRSVKKNKE
jgi:23S rRNA pseudouridine2605 synthase